MLDTKLPSAHRFKDEGWLEDLKHANEMAGAPPGWQAPCFKPKEVKESSSTSKTTSLRFDLPPVPGSSEAPSKTLEVSPSPSGSPRTGVRRSPRQSYRRAATTEGIRLDESPGSTPRDLQRSLTDLQQ